MTLKDPVVILEALRTPIGSFQSSLQKLSAPDLAAIVVRGLLYTTGLPKHSIDEIIMGCVLQAGLGQSPARQVAFKADLLEKTVGTTINKVCGSGMKAVMVAANQLLTGESKAIIAGGMESMSNAPFFIKRPGRKEEPPLHPTYMDHLFHDGLEDAYDQGTSMGVFAEKLAEKYRFSRKDQDAFAKSSVEKAQRATADNLFEREIIPIVLKSGDQTEEVSSDEPVGRINVEKIPSLKPAFMENGTITAASASAITDGAAGLLLMRESEAKKWGLTPRARIVGYASAGVKPEWFTLGPIDAIKTLLERIKWTMDKVDLFEINEAFAVVAMATQRDLGIPDSKLNVHGGACALGHPIGASGARIIVTLLNALEARGLQKGIASLCIGGGEGVAMAIERI
jgi:acetyl-CoA C-acetyltransferase